MCVQERVCVTWEEGGDRDEVVTHALHALKTQQPDLLVMELPCTQHYDHTNSTVSKRHETQGRWEEEGGRRTWHVGSLGADERVVVLWWAGGRHDRGGGQALHLPAADRR